MAIAAIGGSLANNVQRLALPRTQVPTTPAAQGPNNAGFPDASSFASASDPLKDLQALFGQAPGSPPASASDPSAPSGTDSTSSAASAPKAKKGKKKKKGKFKALKRALKKLTQAVKQLTQKLGASAPPATSAPRA